VGKRGLDATGQLHLPKMFFSKSFGKKEGKDGKKKAYGA